MNSRPETIQRGSPKKTGSARLSSMSAQPAALALPPIGLGLWRADDHQARCAVLEALKIGYRLLDTATVHNNEKGVGLALVEAMERYELRRGEIFVTTKLWNDSHSYDAAMRSFDRSLTRLGLEYVDLYMIQWPAPSQNLYVEAWKAIVRLRDEGRIRRIFRIL